MSTIRLNGNESDSDIGHFMIVGTAQKGRSVLLQQEANRLGISYEEIERRYAPDEKHQEQMRMHEEEARVRDERRLQAVRQAVWEAWADDEGEFSRLHDALVSTGVHAAPSHAELKALFMMLPAEIVGKGVAWGFTDTEVGEDLYRFIDENADAVRAQLADAR